MSVEVDHGEGHFDLEGKVGGRGVSSWSQLRVRQAPLEAHEPHLRHGHYDGRDTERPDGAEQRVNVGDEHRAKDAG